MIKKQWKKNQNSEHIVGPCKWCQEELVNTQAFVAFVDKSKACIKCYRKSGHMLPFWDKENKFNE
jgi:hypothetical protein